MRIAVVILNWNTVDYLRRFLPAMISGCEGMDAEVIVADSASTDGSAEMMATEFPDIRLIGLEKNFGFTGVVADQDFIPRNNTAASIVIEGVRPGEDPLHTVMWTILGYPCCSVSVPLLVCDEDVIPSFMKSSEGYKNSAMCDFALRIRNRQIYNNKLSNADKYIDIKSVIDLLHSCLMTESFLESSWMELYDDWTTGHISFDAFKSKYSEVCMKYYDSYLGHFTPFLE